MIRDLFDEKVPALDNETFAAWKRNKYAPETLSDADKSLLARHESYLAEFLSADKYVFVNPMYNGFTTAQLKEYIDVIAVPRKLFRYTETGPVGLLKGKKSLHIQSAGGFYHNEEDPGHMANDLGAPYVAQTANFLRRAMRIILNAQKPSKKKYLKKHKSLEWSFNDRCRGNQSSP